MARGSQCCALCLTTGQRCWAPHGTAVMHAHRARLQVQEAGLVWQLGLVASTVYHMGAAVLPFRARLLAVLDALLQAPSKARPRARAPPRGARAGSAASGHDCQAAKPAGALDIRAYVFASRACAEAS